MSKTSDGANDCEVTLCSYCLHSRLGYSTHVYRPWISLSFKMVPIFLLSFRWGLKAGAMGGLIWGLLQVVT